MLENAAIADLLDEVADLMELKKSDSFRIRAYRNAARSVRTLGVRVADLVERGADLKQIPGIGATIADEMKQMQSTGTTDRREKLREGVPPGLLELLRLPGIGPRKAWELWTKAQIGSIADLRAAVEAKRIRELPGMGEKTEETLRKALANTVPEGPARLFWKDARAHLEAIGRHLDGIAAIARWEAAGSFRRRRETIGDLDILVEPRDREAARRGDRRLRRDRGGARAGPAGGAGAPRRRTSSRLQVHRGGRVRRGADVLHRIKAHNIELRQRAIKRKLQAQRIRALTEDEQRGGGRPKRRSTRARPAVDPARAARGQGRDRRRRARASCRADRDRRSARRPPHAHRRPDGRESIETMVARRASAATPTGDHRPLAIAAHAIGLDEARVRGCGARSRGRRQHSTGLRVLAGIEVDILADGALDLAGRGARASSTGWWRASTRRDREEKAMTERMLGRDPERRRRLHRSPLRAPARRRGPVKLDFERVIQACVEHGVALEINGSPAPARLAVELREGGARGGGEARSPPDAHASASSITWSTPWARRGAGG